MTNQISKDRKPTRAATYGAAGETMVKTGKKGHLMQDKRAIIQGMVWHEILSGPLCKRRRNKQ